MSNQCRSFSQMLKFF